MIDRKTMDYIGDISQIGGVKRYCFTSGKARGVEAFDVNNGAGLQYTVVPDRGMDIHHLSFKGIPISFLSKNGLVAPSYYNDRGYEWLRSFSGGFLTTCGLTQVGEPCRFGGNEVGLHGPYSNIPADNVTIFADWIGDEYVMKLSGHVRQSKVQYENLLLRRSIETCLGMDEIIIEDNITNEGDRAEPFMLLYHMNFGYPFLNPDCEIVLPTRKVVGWDALSNAHADSYLEITDPRCDPFELTWYHEMMLDQDGMTGFMMTNRKQDPDVALVVRYDGRLLNQFVQWRFLHKREYVLALEPCNNLVKGVEHEAIHGNLQYLQPEQSVNVSLQIRFLSQTKAIEQAKAMFLASFNRGSG